MLLARNLERVIKGTSILTNKLPLSVKNNVSISKLSLKSSYDYRSLFPALRHFGFYDVIRLPILSGSRCSFV